MYKVELSTTTPLRPLGNGRRETSHRRHALWEQNLEDTLPESFFAPPAIVVDDGFPWPEVGGQLAPGRGCTCDPEHSLHAPAPLPCRTTPSGLRRLEERAQVFPERIGQLGQPRQTDRFRQGVRRSNRRSLIGAALGVTLLRSGLMAAAETRPPQQLPALLRCRIDPSQESTHFCEAQLETSRLPRPFFSRTR